MIAVLNVLFQMLNSDTSSIRTSVVHAISVQLNNHVARTNVQMINYGTVPRDCSSPCMEGGSIIYNTTISHYYWTRLNRPIYHQYNLPSWHYIECTASESMIMSYGALGTPIKDNEQKIINKQRQPNNTLSNSATLTTGIW